MEISEVDESHVQEAGMRLSSLTSSLATFIEYGGAEINKIIDSADLKDAIDVAGNLGEELADAITVFKKIRAVASIPDMLFIAKVERYCAGLFSIPPEQREKYVGKVGKASLNKDSAFILGVLNKIEELEKVDILVKLFEAKVFEKIDDRTYRRMMLQVDRTMYSDILFLKNNICNEGIRISSYDDEAANLLSTGWLTLDGLYWGSADEVGGYRYKYTRTAKLFCNIVFGMFIDIT